MHSLYHFTLFLSLCLIFPSLPAHSFPEEPSHDFILKTQRVCIHEHPHAFNPSLVRWQGQLLMCFREIIENGNTTFPNIHCSAESKIGLVFLDETFNPVGEAQILDLNGKGTPGRTDDARLVIVGEKLYLVYSDNLDDDVTEGGYRVYAAELVFDGNSFTVASRERMSYFQDECPGRREKNWSPFDYCGNLLLTYSLSPHKVLFPLLGLETCVTVAITWPRLFWRWGELRGGTPGILVDDEYLSIFHSSMDMEIDGISTLHYFIGAYTFEKKPPFAITRMSAKPIVAKGFYSGETYTPYWKPVRVVFPCGLIAEGPYLWMAYGRQDHEIWVAQMDKRGLLDSLRPVPLKD